MERNHGHGWVRQGLTCAAPLVLALALASPIEAQFRIFGGVRGQAREETTDAVTLVSERETTVLLDKAKDLIAKGEITLALSALQKILGDEENSDQPDTFFKSEDQRGLSGGVRAEAQRLIGQLNDEQRATYELQFGVTARHMLDDAVQAGRIDRVAEVVRRYFHTKSGYEAAVLLAQHQLDHGHPLAAGLLLEKLCATPTAAKQFEPQLSLLLVTAWVRAGSPNKAKSALAELKRLSANDKLLLGGKRIDLRGEDSATLAAIASLVSASASGLEQSDHWAMARGNPARNAAMPGGSPLLNVRWQVKDAEDPDLFDEIGKVHKQFIDSGRPVIPAVQPLAVGDYVLVRTPLRLYGIEFGTQAGDGGRLIWKFPTEANAEAPPKNPGRDVSFMHAVTERIFENNTYGTMSSDGELVFMVNEGNLQQTMRGTPMRNNRVVWGPNGQMVQNAGPAAQNILTAHSLRGEGKLIWQIGEEDGSLPDLAQAYFLGPPLPLGGQLYVLAESKKRISLVALEAKTGKLLWTQPLCDVELDVTQDPFRRISGATPSYADGVLVCPTGAGALVAVDLATRSLLWGKQFTVSNEQQQLMMQRMQMGWNFNGQMVQPVNPGTHWVDGSAVVADGRVYVTPMESDKLHCFNLIDGKEAWPSRNREGGLYIGAVTKDHVILVCESQVQALSVADGKTKWSCPLGSNRPSGRGFFSGPYYYLPLSSAEVIKIDLANNGEIKARARSRFGNVPGNLICYQGYVISQSANTVDKFFQLESLRERVTRTLEAKPGDREAIAWRGEIALDDGRLEQAMSDLRQAFNVTPEQVPEGEEREAWTAERERVRELLIDALANAFQTKQPGGRDYLAEIETLIESEEERSRYLRLLAMGRHEDGDISGALEAYLQLADLKTPAQELEDVGGGHSVRRERWIRTRLETLWRVAKAEDRAPVDAAITQRLAAAEQDRENKVAALRKFLSAFGFHPLANRAREQLLLEFSERESPLEREQLLLALEKSGDERQVRTAVARLATLFQAQDRIPEALSYYRRLEREFGDVECLPGLTGKQMVGALPSDEKLSRAMQTWIPWPVGAVEEDRKSRGGRQQQASYQQYWPIDIRGDQGPFFSGRQVLYDQQMYQILGRDEYGRESFRLMLNEAGAFRNYGYGYNTNHGVVDGHLLLVNTGYQVLAIDTLRNQAGGRQRVLWHVDLIDPMQLQLQMMTGWGGIEYQAINNPWGQRMGRIKVNNQPASTMSAVIDGGVAILRGRELTFYEVLTGKPQWTRHNLPPGSDIWGDGELLIVAAPDKDDAVVLRTQDGSEFAKRKAPRPDMRWAFYGRNVLTWREKPGRLHQVFLYDVADGKEIDLGTYPMSSKGTIVGGDSVAIYDTNGKFVVHSLADGSKQLDAKVDSERQLFNIFVQRSADQYMVVTNRPRLAKSTRNINYQPVMHDPYGGTNNGLVSGRIYAFDRQTGASLWQTPAIVEMHGYLQQQPSELPALVFLRHAHDRNQQAKGSILCLDKRTGRAVYQKEDLPQVYNFEASADLEARNMSLQLAGTTMTLKYTDAPTAPEPTYQAQEPPESSNPLYRTPIGRVLRAFGRAADQEVPVPAADNDPFGAGAPAQEVEVKEETKEEIKEEAAKKE